MAISQTDQQKWSELVAKCWDDSALKQELISSPLATLKSHGIGIPDGISIKVVENTPDTFHLVLPPRPSDELSDEALEAVAGGATTLIHS